MHARLRSALAVAAAVLLVAGATAYAALPALPPIADPPTHRHTPGKFVWFDLVTSDPASASEFYRAVFGWEIAPIASSVEQYAIASSEGVAVAGIFKPQEPPKGAKHAARWLSYLSTADLDRAIARLTAAGGKVLVPATTVPGRGRHAIVRDPQGAIVGLLQSASGDRPDEAVGPGEFFWADLFTRDVATASKQYAGLGFTVTRSDVSPDRMVLVAGAYARGGIMPLPADGREPGWLPYVQVDDIGATLERVRAAGGFVLREPRPDLLDGRIAVIADREGGILGIIHWPVQPATEATR